MTFRISNATVPFIQQSLLITLQDHHRKITTELHVAFSYASILHPQFHLSLHLLVTTVSTPISKTRCLFSFDPKIGQYPKLSSPGMAKTQMIQDQTSHPRFSMLSTHAPHETKNHQSARTFSNELCRSIRQGQDDGTYLIVDADIAHLCDV